MITRRTSSNCLKSYFDKDADDYSNNQPQVLKIKAVVVGDDWFLFEKGSSVESGKDAILKAVLESGETADAKVSTLMLALNNDGLHQLVCHFMLRNQDMIEYASPVMNSCAYSSSQESARSPLNPSTHFQLITATNVAVAVIDVSEVDIESTPYHLPTRNEEESPTRNLEIYQKCKAQMLKLNPTDPLGKVTFEFKKNGTVQKNVSGKSSETEKSRQIQRICNYILYYSINQSQQKYCTTQSSKSSSTA